MVYTARYVCFINAPNKNSLLSIKCDQVQHKAVNTFIINNFLLDQVSLNY